MSDTKRIMVDSILPKLASCVTYDNLLLGVNLPSGSGKGINICLIDSGVPNHNAVTTTGIDINFTQTFDAKDRTGHSTILSGIIAGNSANIIGVAPDALLTTAKAVDDNCIVRLNALVAAILWSIIKQVDIIVIPLSTDIDCPDVKAAIKKAYSMGIVIVASAGEINTSEFPAAYEEVLSVGAIGKNRNAMSASGDVNFLGAQLASTYVDQTYALVSGASTATAIAAGICARIIETLKNNKEKYTPQTVYQLIKNIQ